eukprot:g10484.t1
MNINPAQAGFWKPWVDVEVEAPAEMKNPRLVSDLRRLLEEAGWPAACYNGLEHVQTVQSPDASAETTMPGIEGVNLDEFFSAQELQALSTLRRARDRVFRCLVIGPRVTFDASLHHRLELALRQAGIEIAFYQDLTKKSRSQPARTGKRPCADPCADPHKVVYQYESLHKLIGKKPFDLMGQEEPAFVDYSQLRLPPAKARHEFLLSDDLQEVDLSPTSREQLDAQKRAARTAQTELHQNLRAANAQRLERPSGGCSLPTRSSKAPQQSPARPSRIRRKSCSPGTKLLRRPRVSSGLLTQEERESRNAPMSQELHADKKSLFAFAAAFPNLRPDWETVRACQQTDFVNRCRLLKLLRQCNLQEICKAEHKPGYFVALFDQSKVTLPLASAVSDLLSALTLDLGRGAPSQRLQLTTLELDIANITHYLRRILQTLPRVVAKWKPSAYVSCLLNAQPHSKGAAAIADMLKTNRSRVAELQELCSRGAARVGVVGPVDNTVLFEKGTNIQELVLQSSNIAHHSYFQELLVWISKHQHLRRLRLNAIGLTDDDLSVLVSSEDCLTFLEELDLRSNQFTTVPAELGDPKRFGKLQKLLVSRMQVLQLLRLGSSKLKQIPRTRLQLVTVGNFKVGKSTLLERGWLAPSLKRKTAKWSRPERTTSVLLFNCLLAPRLSSEFKHAHLDASGMLVDCETEKAPAMLEDLRKRVARAGRNLLSIPDLANAPEFLVVAQDGLAKWRNKHLTWHASYAEALEIVKSLLPTSAPELVLRELIYQGDVMEFETELVLSPVWLALALAVIVRSHEHPFYDIQKALLEERWPASMVPTLSEQDASQAADDAAIDAKKNPSELLKLTAEKAKWANVKSVTRRGRWLAYTITATSAIETCALVAPSRFLVSGSVCIVDSDQSLPRKKTFPSL